MSQKIKTSYGTILDTGDGNGVVMEKRKSPEQLNDLPHLHEALGSLVLEATERRLDTDEYFLNLSEVGKVALLSQDDESKTVRRSA